MKKRAMSSQVFVAMIIVLVLALTIIFGANSIGKFLDAKAATEQTLFEKEIAPDLQNMAAKPGSKTEKSYLMSGKINKVYFIDPEQLKQLELDLEGSTPSNLMEEIVAAAPEILEEAKDGTGNNMFFYADKELMRATKIDKTYVSFPYFQCFTPKDGKIDVYLEGVKGKTELDHKQERFNCGPQKIRMDEEEVEVVSDESIHITDDNYIAPELDTLLSIGGQTDDAKKATIQSKIDNTKPFVEMARIINIIEEDSDYPTKTDILIKAKGKTIQDFIYIENFPKECLPDEMEYSVNSMEMNIFAGNNNLELYYKQDPQIMWDFQDRDIPENTIFNLKYELIEIMSEDCISRLKGIGFEADI